MGSSIATQRKFSMRTLLLIACLLSAHRVDCLRMVPSTFLRLGGGGGGKSAASIRLWPGKHSYSWEASVDRNTGTATSKEVTHLSPQTSLHRQWEKLVTGQDDSDIWLQILERLSSYPQFLAKKGVTFGFCKAVPMEEGGIALRDRLFGITLLTFGEPRTQRFSIQKQIPSVRGSAHPWTMVRVGDCSVTIPMTGGLLVADKAKHNPNNRDRNHGLLKFEIKHNGEFEETQVTTEIQEYTPAIVGKREPVPFYRKWSYLLTQSLVHAFVMWRFHKFCAKLDCNLSEQPHHHQQQQNMKNHDDDYTANTVRIIKF